MFQKPTELTEFLLEEEKKVHEATGNFTFLLTQIEYAGKIIASHIKKAGLVDILSTTGEKNISEDEVIKLDRYSNDLLVDTLSQTEQVYAIGSEEMADLHYVNKKSGQYLVFVDPLDGSSNSEVDVTVGTIFSIYKHKRTDLPKGREQVAAGYILYGSSVLFVYTVGHGVNGFTFDPSIGSFLLSHPDIHVPQSGNTYSLNEARAHHWDRKLHAFIEKLKKENEETDAYKARYVGSMVADVHRTLIQGGIFIYPNDDEHPEGKLRLMIEVNPMSFLISQAGGIALSGIQNPLDMTPTSLHQRVPIALGSTTQMKLYLSYMQ